MRTEDFYTFMVKRESTRLNKEAGRPWPWTDDKILQEYKFTNVHREDDRTTRWMRDNWTNQNLGQPAHVQLFNCALFRYFGTMEFAEAIGYQYDFDLETRNRIKAVAAMMMAHKKKVFTGAYVITNQGISAPKQEVVVDMFLKPFWDACSTLVEVGLNTESWEAIIKHMRVLQGFGGSGFMAKEVMQDAIHCAIWPKIKDLNTWCPVGPGARRGLNRIMVRPFDQKRPERIYMEEMLELYKARVAHWPGRLGDLALHDVQFQLCEFDKYERVKNGQGRPRSR